MTIVPKFLISFFLLRKTQKTPSSLVEAIVIILTDLKPFQHFQTQQLLINKMDMFHKTANSVRRPILHSPKGGLLDRFYCNKDGPVNYILFNQGERLENSDFQHPLTIQKDMNKT